jgi:hypothetical protein
MRYILILFTALFLFSCNTEKQLQKKEKKYVSWLLANDKMADNCAELFPNVAGYEVRDSIYFDTLYLQSLPDTILSKPDSDTVYVIKTRIQPIIKTVQRDSIITIPNTAAERAWEIKYNKLLELYTTTIKAKDEQITKLQASQDKDNWWKIACIITWAVIGLGIGLKFLVKK